MRLAKQFGVSLAEALTAVFVLALAVTGAAGLQWRALQAAHEAGLQSAASQVAADMAEHIHAFHEWSQHEGRDHPFAGHSGDTDLLREQAVRSCFTAPCTPQQFAAFAWQETSGRAQALLPEGRIQVCRDAHPWDQADKALRWDCAGDDASAPLVVKVGWRDRQAPMSAIAMPPLLALVVLP